MPDDRQFCTFLVDGLYFGIEVLHVQEVIRFQEMTRVPPGFPADRYPAVEANGGHAPVTQAA